AGVTVSYLNDDLVPDPTDPTRQRLIDPTPDLVVANEGSNDVTVWFGKGQGKDWTLEPGPRLKARGSGPVSTAVRYVPDPRGGAPTPDLLIANSQSNTATLLPGVGTGLFDDRPQSVQIFPTGNNPRQVVVGPFVKPGEIDLITVNAGSNNLTFFPNFGLGRSIDSGGNTPLAAVATDLNHDGIMDLLVANNGDGAISLLLGSASGPTLAKVFSSADVKHPTDVALGDDPSVFYVSQEGEETAARFTLDLGLGVIASPSSPGTPARQIATLLPLIDAAPATVATLLTVADEREAALTDSIAALESTLTIGIIVAAVNSGENYEPDAQALLLDDALPELRQAVDANPGLPGFVIGLEEALQRTGLELRQKLFEASKTHHPDDDGGALFREAISIPQALVASAGSAAKQWLTDCIFDVAQSMHGLLGSAAATFGLRDVPLPGSLWQDAADALLQSGRSTMQAVHDALRSLLSTEGSESAPAGHGQIDMLYFEAMERAENELQIADLRLQIEERDDDSGAKSPTGKLQSTILEDTEALTVPLVAALFASGAWQALAPDWQSDGQRTIVRRRALRAAPPS
ncbi:MAG TPA: VCBS repeat-containing protein, partial [Gemmataceae bacterium]|nr:VCBS repeat-containing protein [Gemmataceae bacterium]